MNAIATYWSAVTATAKLVLLGVALLAAFALGGGLCGWAAYAWQSDEVEDARHAQAKAESDLAEAEQDRDGWKDAADMRQGAIDDQNEASARAVKEAQLAKAAAEAAARRADAAADRFLKAKAEYDRLAALESQGNCAAWSRMKVCGSPLQ